MTHNIDSMLESPAQEVAATTVACGARRNKNLACDRPAGHGGKLHMAHKKCGTFSWTDGLCMAQVSS